MQFEELLSEISDQRSPEWVQLRLGRFTSSEIHKLMGEPRNKADKEAGKLSDTAMSYVIEKVAETLTGQKKIVTGKPLEWGALYESEAFTLFSQSIDRNVSQSTFLIFGEHAGGTPDGHADEFIIEIKCPYDSTNHIKYSLFKTEQDLKEEKLEYYWQVQANMLFSGKNKAWFISYDPRVIDENKRMFSLLVHQNEADQALLKTKLNRAILEKQNILNQLKDGR